MKKNLKKNFCRSRMVEFPKKNVLKDFWKFHFFSLSNFPHFVLENFSEWNENHRMIRLITLRQDFEVWHLKESKLPLGSISVFDCLLRIEVVPWHQWGRTLCLLRRDRTALGVKTTCFSSGGAFPLCDQVLWRFLLF